MALYIRDEFVDELAKRVMKATGAATKTEAVRNALEAQLMAEKRKKPLLERINEVRAMADTIGAPDPDFDMKTYTDDMWGDS